MRRRADSCVPLCPLHPLWQTEMFDSFNKNMYDVSCTKLAAGWLCPWCLGLSVSGIRHLPS
jgi:hypothetical protein